MPRQPNSHPYQHSAQPHAARSRPRCLLAAGNGKNQSAVSSSLVSVLKDELKYERESYRREEVLLEGPPCEYGMLDRPGRNTFFLGKEHKGELIQVKVDLENQPMQEQMEDMGEDDSDEDESTLQVKGGCFLSHLGMDVDVTRSFRSLSARKRADGQEHAPCLSQDTHAIHFTVTVLKPERQLQLVFDCESDGEYMSIIHLAFEDLADVAADASPPRRSLQSMMIGMGEISEEQLEGIEDQKDPRYTGPVFEELDDTLQQAFIDYLEERGVTAELGEFLRLYALDKMAVEYQGWLGKVKDFVSL
ncbi:MAG: hypothetical protein WDW38_007063 [Sanguina aurantia]